MFQAWISTLSISTFLIFTAMLWNRFYYNSHFMGEETEVQKYLINLLKVHRANKKWNEAAWSQSLNLSTYFLLSFVFIDHSFHTHPTLQLLDSSWFRFSQVPHFLPEISNFLLYHAEQFSIHGLTIESWLSRTPSCSIFFFPNQMAKGETFLREKKCMPLEDSSIYKYLWL